MAVFIGSDVASQHLRDVVKTSLKENDHGVVDIAERKELDFIDSTSAVVHEVQENDDNLGITVDVYGAGSFTVVTKVKGMTATEVSGERLTYMTHSHNNARMVTMGAETVGDTLAKNIAKEPVDGHYNGGRHQIRTDMLNRMCQLEG